MPIDKGPYLSGFRLILDDFLTMTAYIEPRDENLQAFSHRLYEIFLRACTEFESVCKDALVDRGAMKPRADMDINDYRGLESDLHLELVEVGWQIWRPEPAYVKPFSGWSHVTPPLPWYRDYNLVKHNRNSDFPLASLRNVRLAVSGLFATLASLDLLPTNLPGHREFHDENAGTVEAHYVPYPQLSLRRPR